jgi:hypothetical protein
MKPQRAGFTLADILASFFEDIVRFIKNPFEKPLASAMGR